MVPTGLGWWIAFEGSLDPGPKARDLDVAIERCLATGARWVALRSGAGSTADAHLTVESIHAFRDAGIDPYVWHFAYEKTHSAEVAHYAKWAKAGARGAWINAEFEYQHVATEQARRLVRDVRAAGDGWFVGHAPPDYLGARGQTPSLVALDEECDAIAPQTYAWEHDDRGHAHHVDAVMKLYAARGYGPAKVWPIACSYRPKVRGYDAAGKPKPTPPLANEARRVADDLVAFLDHPLVQVCPAPSIYTLDAITWINGNGDLVIPTLAARAKGRPTLPAPAAIGDWLSIQRALAALGHDPGPIDGILGPRTLAAVQAFQGAAGLVPNGVVDEVTIAALRRALKRDTEPAPAPSSAPDTTPQTPTSRSSQRLPRIDAPILGVPDRDTAPAEAFDAGAFARSLADEPEGAA